MSKGRDPMKKFTHHHPPYLLRISCYLLLLLLLFIILLFFNIPTSSSSSPSSSCIKHHQLLQQRLSSTRRALLAMEEKARIGSTPPSCYNKCNGCHPCLAVQVPTTLPTSPSFSAAPTEFLDPLPAPGRYSNYKPLGWKCRCRNHLFNP